MISCDIVGYHSMYTHLPHVFSTKDLVIDVRPASDGTCLGQQVAIHQKHTAAHNLDQLRSKCSTHVS